MEYFQIFLPFILAFTTIVLAIYTAMMAHEVRKNNRILQTPILSIRLERSKSIEDGKIIVGQWDIIIENISKNPIYNLIFTPIQSSDGISFHMNNLSLLAGIKDMAPYQKFQSIWLNYFKSTHDAQLTGVIKLEYSWEDEKKRKYQNKISFSMSTFYNTECFGKTRIMKRQIPFDTLVNTKSEIEHKPSKKKDSGL